MLILLTLKEHFIENLELTLLLLRIPLFMVIIFFIRLGAIYFKFLLSNYRKEHNEKFFKVIKDKGLYGEYLSFRILEKLPGYKKILTNVYIPKENGQVTELDLVMIHETGIYVIESKNFSGWIFGNNSEKFWTQTLKSGKKSKFYNPILQNENHIKYLKKYLDDTSLEYTSVIAFSERCTLKKITNSSKSIICNRNDLKTNVVNLISSNKKSLSSTKINTLYKKLKPYTNVNSELKENHINKIKNF